MRFASDAGSPRRHLDAEKELRVSNSPKDPARPLGVKMIDHDRVQVEFLIEDLVKQLVKDRGSQIASCNGCNSCSATFGRVNPSQGKE